MSAYKKITLFIMIMMLPVSSAYALEKGSIELQSVAETEIEVINAKGEKEIKRVKVSETKIVPGDEVIFTTYYGHIGKETADDVIITNPVSEHMVYTDLSAEGKGAVIRFSVDDGKSYDLPEKLKVKDKSGSERVASPSDYTHIRWIIKKLKPADKGSVSFRARVK